MATLDATLPVDLGFMPAAHVIDDPDHPGLLRAGPRAGAPYGGEGVEMHACRAVDCSQDGSVQPDLLGFGFATVDLTGLDDLQRTLSAVREAGRITDADAAAIRAAFDGATLPCSDGGTVTVLHLADEGLIMRTAGPNRLQVVADHSQGMNDHGPATSIHADQDVYGTPLVQLMDGRAPELFRHQSPDGANDDAGLMLANLWIPLQQITQPLVLADGRTVDRRRHQLRFGLATTDFLDRDDEMAINDIWTFLPDPDQQWYLRSYMDQRSAYVFNTLSTPHGSCSLPGEEAAEQRYRALESAEAAVAAGDATALRQAVDGAASTGVSLPDSTPPALRSAIDAMDSALTDATQAPEALTGARAEEWLARSRAARRAVVRMSLEMRLVVSTGPR